MIRNVINFGNNGHKVSEQSRLILERARVYQERQKFRDDLKASFSAVLTPLLAKNPLYAGVKRIRLVYHPSMADIARATLARMDTRKKRGRK
jgi:hypothetical protein